MPREETKKYLQKGGRTLTTEQAREIASKSNEARKKKKQVGMMCRDIAKAMLDTKCKVLPYERDILDHYGIEARTVTNRTMLMAALHKKARSGNVMATQYFLQIAGEDPEHNLRKELAQGQSITMIIEDLRALDEQIDTATDD